MTQGLAPTCTLYRARKDSCLLREIKWSYLPKITDQYWCNCHCPLNPKQSLIQCSKQVLSLVLLFCGYVEVCSPALHLNFHPLIYDLHLLQDILKEPLYLVLGIYSILIWFWYRSCSSNCVSGKHTLYKKIDVYSSHAQDTEGGNLTVKWLLA